MKSITIGRSSDCDIILPPDPKVSRIHAKVSVVGGKYLYEDLGKNGSVMNGQWLNGKSVSIAPGTPIMIAGKIPLPWGQIYQMLPLSGVKPYEKSTEIHGVGRHQMRSSYSNSSEGYAEPSLGIGWGILAFLIPLAGWIMYFVWKDQTPKRAQQACTLAWCGFGLNLLMTFAAL